MIQKIVKRLQEMGLNQDAFERLAGLSENRISKWKNGEGEIKAKQALRMSRLLDLPLEYLIDDDLDNPTEESIPPDEAALLVMYRTLKTKGLDLRQALERLAKNEPFDYGTKIKGGRDQEKDL